MLSLEYSGGVTLENLANKIAGFLIYNEIAAEGDRDIFVYGLVHLFSHGIGLAIALVIGFAFAIPAEMLVFFIPFIALRTSAGGYHAGTFWGCAAVSGVTILVIAIVISVLPAVAYLPIIGIIASASFAVIFMFAPVENENRPIMPNERVRFRKRSWLVVVVCIVAIISFLVLGGSHYAFCAALGVGLAASSTVAALIKQKVIRRKAYEKA